MCRAAGVVTFRHDSVCLCVSCFINALVYHAPGEAGQGGEGGKAGVCMPSGVTQGQNSVRNGGGVVITVTEQTIVGKDAAERHDDAVCLTEN